MTSETFASTTAVTEQREPTTDRETRIAVIGSTGRTGKLVLAEGLRRGYALTAFARRPADLAGIDGLSAIVEGDGRRADDVRRAVQGQDAVISIVAPAGRGPTTVVSDAMSALLEGMRETGVRRLVAVSVSAIEGRRPWIAINLVRWILRKPYKDFARMEKLVVSSQLDWTIVRPPLLTNGPATGRVRGQTGRKDLPHGPYHITRADLAATLRDPAGPLLGPVRAEAPAPRRDDGPPLRGPRLRRDEGDVVAPPGRPRRGRVGGRHPGGMERDDRGPDDGGAEERGLRPVVHLGQRGRRRGLCGADPVPVPPGADGPRQPGDPCRDPRRDGRIRVPHPGRPRDPVAGLPRDLASAGGPAERDGLEASAEVLGPQRADRPGGRFLHPARADVVASQIRDSGHLDRPRPRARGHHDRAVRRGEHGPREAIRSRPGDRHGDRCGDGFPILAGLPHRPDRLLGTLQRAGGPDEPVVPDHGLLHYGHRRAGAAGPRERGELDHLAPPEQHHHGLRRNPDAGRSLRPADPPRDGLLRSVRGRLLCVLSQGGSENVRPWGPKSQ